MELKGIGTCTEASPKETSSPARYPPPSPHGTPKLVLQRAVDLELPEMTMRAVVASPGFGYLEHFSVFSFTV